MRTHNFEKAQPKEAEMFSESLLQEARAIARQMLEEKVEEKILSAGEAELLVRRTLNGATPLTTFEVEGVTFYVTLPHEGPQS